MALPVEQESAVETSGCISQCLYFHFTACALSISWSFIHNGNIMGSPEGCYKIADSHLHAGSGSFLKYAVSIPSNSALTQSTWILAVVLRIYVIFVSQSIKVYLEASTKIMYQFSVCMVYCVMKGHSFITGILY